MDPKEVTKNTYPPGLLARSAARMKRIISNITIEPAMFLIAFTSHIDDVSVSQMQIYKVSFIQKI